MLDDFGGHPWSVVSWTFFGSEFGFLPKNSGLILGVFSFGVPWLGSLCQVTKSPPPQPTAGSASGFITNALRWLLVSG